MKKNIKYQIKISTNIKLTDDWGKLFQQTNFIHIRSNIQFKVNWYKTIF